MDKQLREAHLDDFAIRCFRDTADQDYIHARLAYRAELLQQFLWSSLHCLEKYAKCVLMLNRIRVPQGHQVSESLALLKSEGRFSIALSQRAQGFVDLLESGAEFRYFEVSHANLGNDIIALDRAVWEIRRYCQSIGHPLSDETPEEILAAELDYFRRSISNEETGTCIFSGLLETIIVNPKHAAREALLWKNFYFGRKRNAIKNRQWWQQHNAPLFLHPEILDDVLKYVHIPKRVIDAVRKTPIGASVVRIGVPKRGSGGNGKDKKGA